KGQPLRRPTLTWNKSCCLLAMRTKFWLPQYRDRMARNKKRLPHTPRAPPTGHLEGHGHKPSPVGQTPIPPPVPSQGYRVGDRVITMGRSGMWQEVVVVAADRTFPMPEQMSFEEGAALPINYLTAYMMLFEMANVRSGQSVLIHMAAGGVGIAATQLCHTVPDVTVFGTASPSKHEIIAQGGVTHPIDYRTKDYVEEIRKISPQGVNIVLDPLSGSDTQKGFSLLKPLGTLIVFGAANTVTGQKKNLLALAKTWYNQLSLSTLKLMQANKAIGGFHLGHIADEQLIRRTMFTLLELYNQGHIKPRIDSRYHFEEVADAMRRMHERQNIGKVILLPEAKKEEEKPTSSSEPTENVEKTEAAVTEKEEAAAEEVKAEKD
uniref:Enoyl reductase (ER) domain-containing protein n=1 Tax=Mola mola TaxID=94237 RepID=A0A3Q3X0E0_MOLML